MYVCAGGRAKANRQASSIEELRQSLATTRSHLEDIAAVEGGNEAQSQGEGVAEFRALQVSCRIFSIVPIPGGGAGSKRHADPAQLPAHKG